MFSVRQKREIATAVQLVLRRTNHPELPDGEISFELCVWGKQPYSWARIKNNMAVSDVEAEMGRNAYSESLDPMSRQK